MTRRVLNLLIAALAVTVIVAMSLAGLRAGQGAAARCPSTATTSAAS